MEISTSVVVLQPGLYILRHPGAGMPALSIAITPRSVGKSETLVTNKKHGHALINGSDCLVMSITEAPVELLVAAYGEAGNVVTPAIKIDRIALDAASGSGSVSTTPSPVEKGLSIVAHVERRGDVIVRAGEMAGDINAVHRLEGFQIIWPDRPDGVDLAYAVVIEGIGATPVVKSGHFIGTRREAKRITEVTLALIGPNAAQYKLKGTAIFSGGFQIPIQSGLPLGGPSGREHLSGFMVDVLAAPEKKLSASISTPALKKLPATPTAAVPTLSKKVRTKSRPAVTEKSTRLSNNAK